MSQTLTVGPDNYSLKVKSKKAFINRIYPENAPEIETSSGFSYSLETNIDSSSSTQGLGIAMIEAHGEKGIAAEYIFLVAGNEYQFATRRNHVGKMIIGRTASKAINLAGRNKLAVKLEGAKFSLLINGTMVSEVDVPNISAISKLSLGVVYNQDLANAETIYEFDNYEIRALP